jgi:hypothetical protein
MRLIALMLEDRGINTLYTMPTYDLLRLRAITGVEADLQAMGVGYTLNKSEFSISIHDFGVMYFRSYDNPNRLIAFECAHSICDELDVLTKEQAAVVWRKVSERTRQICVRGNSIGAVTTPDQGFSGFVYDRWVTRADSTTHLIKASTTSNPFLPAGYVEQIRANYDPALAEMYINGEFVSLTANKVYHYFDRTAHATSRELADGDRLHISIDFNVGGCCATVVTYDGENPRVIDEFVSHDTADFIINLGRFDGHDITVYPDASGRAGGTNASASDIAMIEAAGYSVDAPAANPFIRDRVNSVSAMISHGRLLVNIDKCPDLCHALETQGYDKSGQPEKFKTHPAIDDWNDSLGYLISRCHPISRLQSSIKINW